MNLLPVLLTSVPQAVVKEHSWNSVSFITVGPDLRCCLLVYMVKYLCIMYMFSCITHLHIISMPLQFIVPCWLMYL